jgi:hypothetical protein
VIAASKPRIVFYSPATGQIDIFGAAELRSYLTWEVAGKPIHGSVIADSKIVSVTPFEHDESYKGFLHTWFAVDSAGQHLRSVVSATCEFCREIDG